MVTDAAHLDAIRKGHGHYHFNSLMRPTHVGPCAKMAATVHTMSKNTNSRQSVWATKVLAIIQSGNAQAAVAQIKVAPTVKDLQQLRKLMQAQKLPANRLLDEALDANLALLSAPRLHRAP